MPSEIYNLAKSYADELSKLNKKKSITLDEFLNQKPEPTDQEIIEKITILKDQSSVLTNFFKESNGFIKAIGEIVPVENNLVTNKEFILFEQFISSCAKSINREKVNQYNQENSLLYQFSDEILVEILKFLSQEELAQMALVNSRFANIVNEIITKAPTMQRDYNKTPMKTSKSIARISHISGVKMGASYLYLLTPHLQLIMSFRNHVFIYDIISGENLKTLTLEETFTAERHILCLAQLSDKLVIATGEINFPFKRKNNGFIDIWDIQNYECVLNIPCDGPIEGVSIFSANEFCTAFAKEIKFWINKNKIWECVKNIKINTTDPKDKIIGLIAIPKQNQLIVATQHQLYICDTQEPKIIQTAALPQIDINCIQISPDQKYLAIGATNGKIYLWRKEFAKATWKNFKTLQASSSAVTAITFLGDKIICGSLGDPKNRKGGHVRAFEWKKKEKKIGKEMNRNLGVELQCGNQIVFLGAIHGLLVSVDLDKVNLFYFPKLKPMPAPITEEKKAETKNVVADAKQTKEENNKDEVADTEQQQLIFMP